VIVGKTAKGATTYEMAADTKRVAYADFPAAARVPKLTAYLDSLGSGAGPQAVRAVVYDAADALVAQGAEVQVAPDSLARWVDLPFDAPGGVEVRAPGVYALGLHAGPTTGNVRAYGDAASPRGGKWNADAYADGAAATFGAATAVASDLSVFATAFSAWEPPFEEDAWYARLGFAEAQRKLGETQPTGDPPLVAYCTWHGTSTDDEQGSFALVSADGPLRPLVGERLRITRADSPSFVYVYAHNAADFAVDDAEISLTRPAFMALGELALDRLRVTVEVLS
jgi:hypothetical protein